MATTVTWLQYVTWDGVDYAPGMVGTVDDHDVTRLLRTHYIKLGSDPLPPVTYPDPLPQYLLDTDLDDEDSPGYAAIQARLQALVDAVLPAGVDALTAPLIPDTDTLTGAAVAAVAQAAANALVLGRDTIVPGTLAGGTYNLDADAGDTFILTMTANTVLAPTNLRIGQAFSVQVEQDAVGGRVLTRPDAVGDTEMGVLSTAANTYHLLVYRVLEDNNGDPYLDVTHVKGPVAMPIWTPTKFADKIAWWDPNTLVAADATDVQQLANLWPDRDLWGSATAGTYPKVQTAGGRRYLAGDGINDMLTTGTALGTYTDLLAAAAGAKAQPFTVAANIKVNAAKTATQSAIGGRSTVGDAQLYVQGSAASPVPNVWTAHNGSALSSGLGDSHVWTRVVAIYHTPGTCELRVQRAGDAVPTVVTANAGGEGLASARLFANATPGNYLAGGIGDVLIVGHAVQGGELANFENWLGARRNTLAGL